MKAQVLQLSWRPLLAQVVWPRAEFQEGLSMVF